MTTIATPSTASRRLRNAMIAAASVAAALTLSVVSDAQASGIAASTYAKDGNAYVETSTAKIGFAPLDVRGVVTNPLGVSSLTLSFAGAKSGSCTVGSTVYHGSFYVALPATQTVYLRWLTTKATKDATIPVPTCSVAGQVGRPIGYSFAMTVTGKSYGTTFTVPVVATKTMTIKVGG